jgi:putative transposase
MNPRQPYPTDLTDEQWARLEPHLPPAAADGRPRAVPIREVLNAYFYLLRAGCAWRLLPHDLPKWQTVYSQVRRWKAAGVWAAVHARVRADVRLEAEGKPAEPSAAALDSQTVKAADHAGARGYDAGEKNPRAEAACAG